MKAAFFNNTADGRPRSQIAYVYAGGSLVYVACLEEIAYRRGYISSQELASLGEEMKNSSYGEYLCEVAGGESE